MSVELRDAREEQRYLHDRLRRMGGDDRTSAFTAPRHVKQQVPIYQLREDGGRSTFPQWKRQFIASVEANQYDLRTTILLVHANITGKASDLSQNLSTDPAAYNNDPGQFWRAVDRCFLSPAHYRIAEQEFNHRRQQDREPIRTFAGFLMNLYVEGQCHQDEKWRD